MHSPLRLKNTRPKSNPLAQAICELTTPLPGSIPYENRREIRIKERYDCRSLEAVLITQFPHIGIDYWKRMVRKQKLLLNGCPAKMEAVVRAGNILTHITPNTIEPTVNNNLGVIYEDQFVIAVDKPAPLPVHPSGRYNKNTLISFLNTAQSGIEFRIVHRLDADTTGILILAKSKMVARHLRNQFDKHEISKTYLALVAPVPQQNHFSCNASISPDPDSMGARKIKSSTLSSCTDFEVVNKFPDHTALLKIDPRTGRTNQIRLHLQYLGHPVVGDRIYGAPNSTTHNSCAPNSCLHLHSSTIQFRHPETETLVELRAPAPDWLRILQLQKSKNRSSVWI